MRMSSDIAIKVQNLYKCFEIYEKPYHRLLQMLHRGHRRYFREFWAVKDISLEVGRGETVGIIGRNGSGKSTLLQMICGTLNATSGTIETNGRIAALLELGSGFNPEFTGRENVYMKSSILGLTSEEIDDRFASIAEFAEIGDFIEQPVRTYSSGMMVRLAFAVAINVDPQILVVDEALSVGDERFQRKCFARIESIKESGATILFVSHSGGTIVSLCDRGILLDKGEKIIEGLPKKVVGEYHKLLYAPEKKHTQIRNEIIQSQQATKQLTKDDTIDPPVNSTQHNHSTSDQYSDLSPEQHFPATIEIEKITQDAPIQNVNRQQNYPISPERDDASMEDDTEEFFAPDMTPTSTVSYVPNGAIIDQVKILTLNGKQVNCLINGRAYYYQYVVSFTADVTNVRFGMLIKTTSGIELGGGVSAPTLAESIPVVESGSRFQVTFRYNAILNPGSYFLNAGITGQLGEKEGYLHRLIDAAMFRILPNAERKSTAIIDFGCLPEIKRIL